jgi:hypothetical protein
MPDDPDTNTLKECWYSATLADTFQSPQILKQLMTKLASHNVASFDRKNPNHISGLVHAYLHLDKRGVELNPQEWKRLEEFLRIKGKFPDSPKDRSLLVKAIATYPNSVYDQFLATARESEGLTVRNPDDLAILATKIRETTIAEKVKAAEGDVLTHRWDATRDYDAEEVVIRKNAIRALRERLGGRVGDYVSIPLNLPPLVSKWLERSATNKRMVVTRSGTTPASPAPAEFFALAEKDLDKLPVDLPADIKDGLMQLELLETYIDWIPSEANQGPDERSKAFRFVQLAAARIICERKLGLKWAHAKALFLSETKVENNLVLSLNRVLGPGMGAEFLRAYKVVLKKAIELALDQYDDEGALKQLIEGGLVSVGTLLQRCYPTTAAYYRKDGKGKSARNVPCRRNEPGAVKFVGKRPPTVALGQVATTTSEKTFVGAVNTALTLTPGHLLISKDPRTRLERAEAISSRLTALERVGSEQVLRRRAWVRHHAREKIAAGQISGQVAKIPELVWQETNQELKRELEALEALPTPRPGRNDGIALMTDLFVRELPSLRNAEASSLKAVIAFATSDGALASSKV